MRIVIVGAGVAGGIIAGALAGRPDFETWVIEQVAEDDHAFAGNGLNVGPNALVALDRVLPSMAARLRSVALPWQQWRASTVGGELLYDLPIAEVAVTPGIRIRWAELYRACREKLGPHVRYQSTVRSVRHPPDGGPLSVTIDDSRSGTSFTLDGVDLLVAADGRYSRIRETLCGIPRVTHLGVANYRVLLQDHREWPIDDLEQWFNGPNRLLAFRLHDGLVYLSGNLPIEPGAEIPDAARTAAWLAHAYTPPDGQMTPVARHLLEGACRAAEQGELHWSRLQEIDTCFAAEAGRVLFIGDAAHAMVPTLGQGATTAIEDAAALIELLRGGGIAAADMPARFAAWRDERIAFVRAFSWAASDVLIPKSFSLDAVRVKGFAPYADKLRQLYAPPV